LERFDVAIVIPAFNEAATIGRIVKFASAYGRPLVVDDGSVDETASMARAAGAVVVSHKTNRGYDEALNSGFAEADRHGCTYVVTFDADGQHDATLIGEFVAHLRQGNELVLGIRPQYARLAEGLFALYTRMRFGLRDPLCGMKGYRMSLYRELGRFDSYQSIGTELALYGLRRKKLFIQLQVPISERNGAPRFAQFLHANYKILRAMILSWIRVENVWFSKR
jgi:glycosyltransferase involved in cell wall biosynthesis